MYVIVVVLIVKLQKLGEMSEKLLSVTYYISFSIFQLYPIGFQAKVIGNDGNLAPTPRCSSGLVTVALFLGGLINDLSSEGHFFSFVHCNFFCRFSWRAYQYSVSEKGFLSWQRALQGPLNLASCVVSRNSRYY